MRCEVAITAMLEDDRDAVMSIYAECVVAGAYTFVTETPSWDEWDDDHVPECRLVARSGGRVVGFAVLARLYAHEWLAGVAELSIYVKRGFRGRGIGSQLLCALKDAAAACGFWNLQAFIFPENRACIELHERAGFHLLGTSRRLARLRGVWRDVLVYECGIGEALRG